jgi:hypothetical protein
MPGSNPDSLTPPTTPWSLDFLLDANAGQGLDDLGFSAWMKTRVGDANAGAELTQLGYSAYMQSLKAAASATALGTLTKWPLKHSSDYGNDIDAMIAALGAGPYTVHVDADSVCSVNTTCGAGIHFLFEPNCVITVNNGITLTLASPEHVHCPQRQRAFTLVGTGKAAFSGSGTVYPGWWGAAGDGATDDTAALVAAELSLPIGATEGGVIILPAGTYLLTNWTPTHHNLVIRGAGQYATVLLGSGAGAAVINMTNLSRHLVADLSIDGNGVKASAMICGPAIYSSCLFLNLRMLGATTNTLDLGDPGNPDVSSLEFVGCAIQSGASNAEIRARGTNTGPINFFGCRISTGSSATGYAVDLQFGILNFHSCVLLARPDDYAVIAASGIFRVFGGHVEAQGLVHTLAGDTRTDRDVPPHQITGMSCATPAGFNTIYHESQRTLVLDGFRAGGDIRVGTLARLVSRAARCSLDCGVIAEGNARIVSPDLAAGNGPVLARRTLVEQIYGLGVSAANLRGLWLFDRDNGTVTILDRSEKGHNATLSANAVTLYPEVTGLAAHLRMHTNAPFADFTVANHADFSFGNSATDTPFTLAVLVKPYDVTNAQLVAKWNEVGPTNIEWRLFFGGDDKLYISRYDDSASALRGRKYNTALTGDEGSWHTYVATSDGSAPCGANKIYRDGVRVDDTDDSYGSYVAMEVKTADVGCFFTQGSGVKVRCDAHYALAAVIAAELSAATVLRLHNLLSGYVGR